ncbi:distal tail fiber assembly catalyst protein [Serratia phage Muldoon]|uniref:Distal tail fiber assembly catalyst protein n=1 Tax=Serratia phage Muldoon TaxID=2601678 RepID=A0A5P8PHK7_9CAUD|nr:tail fiber protein; host specificity [Serratia phage Muldoon]QFR56196.1 distal tail fiber assembly catalyst protein [Serratia phage Muldoon]
MAGVVPNVPFWASDVRNVTGTGNMWDAGVWLLKRQPPFWMSEFAGKGEITINITSSNHNFDPNWLVNHMSDLCAGNWAGQRFIINITSGVQLVGMRKGIAYSATGDCMWFGGDMRLCESIIINNWGDILGRGAQAIGAENFGSPNGAQNPPNRGGHAIIADGVGGILTINNHNNIGGGGGAGMGDGPPEWWDGIPHGSLGGQGGAPFGESMSAPNRVSGGQFRRPPNAGYGPGGNGWYSYEDGNSRIRYGQSGGWGEQGYTGSERGQDVQPISNPGRAVYWTGARPNIQGGGWYAGGDGQ